MKKILNKNITFKLAYLVLFGLFFIGLAGSFFTFNRFEQNLKSEKRDTQIVVAEKNSDDAEEQASAQKKITPIVPSPNSSSSQEALAARKPSTTAKVDNNTSPVVAKPGELIGARVVSLIDLPEGNKPIESVTAALRATAMPMNVKP